jgi:tetratricopeptide (TPR) repeat protein
MVDRMKSSIGLLLCIALTTSAFSQEIDEIDQELLEDLFHLTPAEAQSYLAEMDYPKAYTYANALADLWMKAKNLEFAEFYLMLAFRIAEQGDLPFERGYSLYRLGLFLCNRRDQKGAIQHVSRARDQFYRIGDLKWYVKSLLILGDLQHMYGYLADSLETYQRILENQEQIEHRSIMAEVHTDIAMLMFKLGSLDGVPEHLEVALKIFESENNTVGVANVYRTYGNYYAARGDETTAIEYYQRAALKYDFAQDYHGYANTSFNIGLILQGQQQYEQAISLFKTAITSFTMAGSTGGAGMAQTELARIYYLMDRCAEAEVTLQLAITQLHTIGSFRRLAIAESVLGDVYVKMQKVDEALVHYREAESLFSKLGLLAEADQIHRITESLK